MTLKLLDDPSEELAEIEVIDVEHDTELALLCKLKNGIKVWVPRSVVDDSSDVKKEDDDGTLVVQRWWAEKRGLA